MLIEIVALFIILICLFYRWATKNNDFFAKRNLPYEKPVFYFGGTASMFFRKKSFFQIIREFYEKCPNEKVLGVFEQRTPLLIIRDPDLVKNITVKHFEHFINHRSLLEEEVAKQDLFGSSLFMMKDSKWRDMRSTLSPIFTGSKMRHMFQLMNEVAENTLTYLKAKEIEGEDGIELEVKDFSTRFTNDTIASVAFGLQVNSFENMDNEFYKRGRMVTNIRGLQTLRFFLLSNLKFLSKLFNLQMFGKDVTEYFMHLVLDAMKYRKEHKIIRPDMIHMLMEAHGIIKSDHPKPHDREWTDIEIVAQCFVFFFAGFETSSVLMCFTAHELMENQEVQQKLYEEIKAVDNELDGKKLDYETLQGMKYLDMVISEVLRKWPPALVTDRLCNKEFTFKFDDGSDLSIEKGDIVWIPIAGFHFDPKFFPNPEKFDPERFSDENKHKIHPFTYMPFGVGPRNCIGSRFALLETKALIYYLVRDFCIEAGKRTTLPLELAKDSFQLTAKNGFWLKFTSRSSK